MEGKNRVKQVLSAGERPAFGVWQMLPGSNLARTLARSGYDWVLVDCEHGNIDDAAMHESVPAIASYGVSPIVRIPDLHSWMIKRALDAGAHGLLAPLIRTVEDAKSFVEAARFPPQGKRGFGSPFAMDRFGFDLTANQYLEQANANILLAVQIETKEALENVDTIAALDGVDLLFVGPFDLGNGIGFPVQGDAFAPELEQAIRRVMLAAHERNKKTGIFCSNGKQAKHYVELGFDLVNVLTDVGALSASLSAELQVVAPEAPSKKPSGPYGN
ncbi:Phosphoenolpyruvate/pyruvate domain-containing protein [Aspergillus ambiguus]|uniref:HpcH/HpaI aldolase family protein n=1 Tax=Aspergillus ambiguus TaxID=176160 RepID=UPI003CCDB731